MSSIMGKATMWAQTEQYKHRRWLEAGILDGNVLYPCSENKGADQLTAKLIAPLFSHM